MKRDQPEHRPAEEEALKRAMTSIDPLLRASLQREQTRRRTRWLLGGGFAMLAITATWFLATAIQTAPGPAAQSDSNSPPRDSNSTTLIAQLTAATDAAREGWKLWQSGDSVAAEAKFEEATKLDPDDANNWNGLGWSRMQQHDYEAAWQAFERCLKIDGKHPAGLNGAGQLQLQFGKFEAAETYLAKAAAQSPAARFGLARVQLLRGKYAAAARSLRQLAAADNGELDQALLKQMRDAARDKKLSPELKARLEPPKLADTDPDGKELAARPRDNPISLNAQGWQLLNTGKPRPAEAAFRAALAVQPEMLAAKNGLGFSLLNQQKGAEAKPIFAELVQTDATHPGFVNGLARSCELLGESDKAVELWRSVEKPGGPVTACTWGLARVLTEMGKFDEALPVWERIAKQSPDDKSVQQMLDKCRQGASS
jgi:Flp pilus assembly protein TadD